MNENPASESSLMPFSDPETRRLRAQEWRKERTPEYNKWLYERRALVRDQRNLMMDALRRIGSGTLDKHDAEQLASDTLNKAERLAVETGNRFDHELNRPYWEED